MDKRQRQLDCLRFLEETRGVRVVPMDQLESYCAEVGARALLEMCRRGGDTNGMVVHDSFGQWTFTGPVDPDQEILLVMPSSGGARAASVMLFDAEEIVLEMCLAEEFEEWNAERLWEELEAVPFSEDGNGGMVSCVEWNGFPAGTDREEIWHWFDSRHPKGVYYLLYGEEVVA